MLLHRLQLLPTVIGAWDRLATSSATVGRSSGPGDNGEQRVKHGQRIINGWMLFEVFEVARADPESIDTKYVHRSEVDMLPRVLFGMDHEILNSRNRWSSFHVTIDSLGVSIARNLSGRREHGCTCTG